MTPEGAEALLRRAFEAAVAAAQPAGLALHLPEPPRGRLVVVAAGKAAAAMARAVEAHYRARHPATRLEGLVVTRYGHALPTRKLAVLEAGHPLPDAAGVRAAERILALAQGLGADDLLLCLVSGGGSALLAAPEGVSLAEMLELTRALLASGAEITEMNAVRKHLSRVQGGRLAAAAAPARVVSLILSDVVGDDLSSVASGPTAPDPSTYEEALAVLVRYGLSEVAGGRVRRALEAGARGERPETPKPGDPLFERVENVLVGSGQQSLMAAAQAFAEAGVTAYILSDSVTGEAREVAKVHAAIVRQIVRHGQPFAPPCALLSGGETTVSLRRPGGRGGRNSAFALALALELNGLADVYALAADSDGIDGSEANAGAFVFPGDVARLGRAPARELLDADESYGFFEAAGRLLVTGPTHTNVNDLRFILIG